MCVWEAYIGWRMTWNRPWSTIKKPLFWIHPLPNVIMAWRLLMRLRVYGSSI